MKIPISALCKLGKFQAVNHSDVTNLSLRARQDKLLPTGEFYRVVLRRELGGNAAGKKSVMGGIGVGYREDPRRAKKSTPPVGGDFEKTLELYCNKAALNKGMCV